VIFNARITDVMLTFATLGILCYGLYSVIWAIVDRLHDPQLELWADLGAMLFGSMLSLSAAFVRVQLPGGLAFAMGAMLGLQSLAVHNAVHFNTGVMPQIVRGVLAGTLVVLAYLGGKHPSGRPRG
jgi:hypothetical protein